jgi:protein regulator of cytokinesis 1
MRQIEEEMLTMIPVWEEANGRPFVVQGERVVDKIHEALEAKEAAKEAKKVCNAFNTPSSGRRDFIGVLVHQWMS